MEVDNGDAVSDSGLRLAGRTKGEDASLLPVAVRTCRVSCRDLKGIEHTVEVTADSLYEAVAQALRTFRKDTSVDEIVGDRIQTVATAKDSKGNALGKKASWSSSNPGVAEVEVDGNLTAKGPGETTVVASMGFIKGVCWLMYRT